MAQSDVLVSRQSIPAWDTCLEDVKGGFATLVALLGTSVCTLGWKRTALVSACDQVSAGTAAELGSMHDHGR